MRHKGRCAAAFLHADRDRPPEDKRWASVSEVLDFFQALGAFAKSGHVNLKLLHKSSSIGLVIVGSRAKLCCVRKHLPDPSSQPRRLVGKDEIPQLPSQPELARNRRVCQLHSDMARLLPIRRSYDYPVREIVCQTATQESFSTFVSCVPKPPVGSHADARALSRSIDTATSRRYWTKTKS